MAGPNPYRLYSFEELRAGFGKSWLVCEWCRRFAPLAGNLKGRDTRDTTFSCSLCGGVAKHVFEDPAKGGKLQFDPRQQPCHHTDAVVRLKVAAEMRRRQEERHGKVAREDLPQGRRERPKPEPRPTYTLKPFPVRTFGDIATWGLKAEVQCGRCRRRGTPLEVGENMKAVPLLGPRLRCTAIIPGNAVAPDRVCEGRGEIRATPTDMDGVPAAAFVSVCCSRQDHTLLDVGYLLLDRPPWQGYLAKGENFGCAQCGHHMAHTWHQVSDRE